VADDDAKQERASRAAARKAAAKTGEFGSIVPPEQNKRSDEERNTLREKAAQRSSGIGQDPEKGVAAALAAGREGLGQKRLAPRMKRPAMKIIFFVDGNAPTKEEYDAAQTLGMGVVMRNARKIVLGAPLENCDAVAALKEETIPKDYLAVFPQGEEGMEIDDMDDQANLVLRPRRAFGRGTSPDDVRPGTVDTGLAHATGTGSSQAGVRTSDPSKQPVHDLPNTAGTSEARGMADEWKTNKTPGAVRAA
jgi:hypothetical protein